MLIAALEVRFESHHRFFLQYQRDRLEAAERARAVAALDAHINEKQVPYAALLARLMHMSAPVSAMNDRETPCSPPHVTSRPGPAWSRQQRERGHALRSAAKHKDNVHLVTTLVQAALGATTKRGSYYKDLQGQATGACAPDAGSCGP